MTVPIKLVTERRKKNMQHYVVDKTILYITYCWRLKM